MKEPENFCFCLIFVDFFLTLSNKRNKVSGDHDRRTQGGCMRWSGGGALIKKSMWEGGGVSPMGVFFYVGSLFSPRGGHAIFPCVCGGVSFSAWGGGALLGLPP